MYWLHSDSCLCFRSYLQKPSGGPRLHLLVPQPQAGRLVKALKDLRVAVVVNLEWFPLVVDQGLEAYIRIPSDRQERESEWRQAWETFNR